MLTEQGCRDRRNRLWASLPPETEWVIVADPRHVNYFSGFWVNPISFSTSERGLLLLQRDGAATLCCDNFTLRSSNVPLAAEVISTNWYDHLHAVGNRDHALFDALRQLSHAFDPRTGAVEGEWLPLAAIETLRLQDISESKLGSTIRSLRRAKHDDEIQTLAACMRACEAGHVAAFEAIKPGVREVDVYRAVQSAAVEQAGQAAVVYGDFRAVDGDTPKRGGLPTTYELKTGELFIVDYSVVLDGYRSDFTNTIAVGAPTADQRDLHAACVTALQAGEAALGASVQAAHVSRVVSESFTANGYPALSHHAGHGLGLGHPEPPILVAESSDTLEIGDVVTLEPGAYLPGVGGVRLEHNFLISADGSSRLSHHELLIEK